MNYEALSLGLEPPVGRVVLRRPETGNEVDFRMLMELADVAERVTDDHDIRVLLLEAEGDDFCRGWAPEVIRQPPESDPFAPIASLTVPVLCALQGEVASAGLELALTCDIRIAAASLRCEMPDVGLGWLPFGGGTQRLPRTVGRGRALAMLLAGEALDAAGALRAGLVSRIVEAAELKAAAEALARQVAGRGPIAIRYAKEAIHRGLDMTLEQALRYETDLTVILQTTEDRAEGVKAFFEGRRSPQFKGK